MGLVRYLYLCISSVNFLRWLKGRVLAIYKLVAEIVSREKLSIILCWEPWSAVKYVLCVCVCCVRMCVNIKACAFCSKVSGPAKTTPANTHPSSLPPKPSVPLPSCVFISFIMLSKPTVTLNGCPSWKFCNILYSTAWNSTQSLCCQSRSLHHVYRAWDKSTNGALHILPSRPTQSLAPSFPPCTPQPVSWDPPSWPISSLATREPEWW